MHPVHSPVSPVPCPLRYLRFSAGCNNGAGNAGNRERGAGRISLKKRICRLPPTVKSLLLVRLITLESHVEAKRRRLVPLIRAKGGNMGGGNQECDGRESEQA